MSIGQPSLTRRRFAFLLPVGGASLFAISYPRIRPELARWLDLRDAPLPSKPRNALRVGTWNLRNFGEPRPKANARPDAQFEATDEIHDLPRLAWRIEGLAADVLAVQEIHDPVQLAAQLPSHYEGAFSEHGGRHGQRLGLLFDRRRVRLESRREYDSLSLDGLVRPALAVILTDLAGGSRFVTIVVHLKAKRAGHEQRQQQWQALQAVVRQYPEALPVVMLGDFNVTGAPGGTADEERLRLERHLSRVGLARVETTPGCTAYWEGMRQDHRYVPSSLDLIWLRGFAPAAGDVLSAWAGAHCRRARCGVIDSTQAYPDPDVAGLSDHCPLLTDLAWP